MHPLLVISVLLPDHVRLHIKFLDLEIVFRALKKFQSWLCHVCGTLILVIQEKAKKRVLCPFLQLLVHLPLLPVLLQECDDLLGSDGSAHPNR